MERPLLITSSLVWPVLKDEKSETRRLRDLDPINGWPDRWKFSQFSELDRKGRLIAVFDRVPVKDVLYQPAIKEIPCPYGNIGDQLWGRETGLFLDSHPKPGWIYKADSDQELRQELKVKGYKWTPSIHMPRRASRIQLEILDLGCERLQEISQEAAKREGMVAAPHRPSSSGCKQWANGSLMRDCFVCSFRVTWMQLNGKTGLTWDFNPWVWTITFKRLTS